MQLGIYGWDEQIKAVVEAALAEGERIVLACDLLEEDAAGLPAGCRRATSWEAVVDENSCEAVLVGRRTAGGDRDEGLRKLVQAGRRLLLSHPATESMLLAFELDMIRADTAAILLPCLPDRLHPFAAAARRVIEASLAEASPIGRLEAILFARPLPDRERTAVLAAFARDADLIRVLTGDPQRLATLGSVAGEAAYANLTVELGSGSQLPIRWQVSPGEGDATLTIRGDAGEVVISIGRDWRWEGPFEPDGPGDDTGPARMLGLLAAAVRGEPTTVVAAGEAITPADWPDAARAIELAEAVPRSLAKGRAIDLHQEEFSEIGTFKGTMASLGCGLVLAALLVLLLATLVGGIAREAGWEIGERVASAWPLVVLAVLAGFLALQALPMLVAPPNRKPPRDS